MAHINAKTGRRKKAVSKKIFRIVYDRFHGQCASCGATENLSCDHIKAETLAGDSDNPDDFQLLCCRCNQFKSWDVEIEFEPMEKDAIAKEIAEKSGKPVEEVIAMLAMRNLIVAENQTTMQANCSKARQDKKAAK